MTPFILGALLLAGIAVLLVVRPLWRRPASADFSRQQLNAAIYRDQLAELERDRNQGTLSQADYEQAQAELQRRLLEDVSQDGSPPQATTATTSRPLSIALAGFLPIAAVVGYLVLGNPAAINPPHQQRFSQDDIEKMVSGLAAKLEQEPENYQGWAMLARSYKMMGRFPEAAKAYGRTGTMLDQSPDLLVDYADTLAAVSGFDGKVLELLDKALMLDPENMQGLWLRGTAAFEAKRYDKAITDWEKLLKSLPADSEEAQVIRANLEETYALAGKPASRGAKPGKGKATAAGISGQVELAPALAGRLPADAIAMVIARPNDGSRMPVAVLRIPQARLPLSFTLDDRHALQAERKPSQFAELQLEARISLSGQAMSQSGDLFGPPQVVKQGAAGVRLNVDQIKP